MFAQLQWIARLEIVWQMLQWFLRAEAAARLVAHGNCGREWHIPDGMGCRRQEVWPNCLGDT
jgi:hypothetical protein